MKFLRKLIEPEKKKQYEELPDRSDSEPKTPSSVTGQIFNSIASAALNGNDRGKQRLSKRLVGRPVVQFSVHRNAEAWTLLANVQNTFGANFVKRLAFNAGYAMLISIVLILWLFSEVFLKGATYGTQTFFQNMSDPGGLLFLTILFIQVVSISFVSSVYCVAMKQTPHFQASESRIQLTSSPNSSVR